MKDSWNRYERDYYPKRPEFDNSLHTAKDYVRLLQKPNDFLFVAEEQGKIVGVAIGEVVRGSDKTGDLARSHALRELWSSAYWKRTAVHACPIQSLWEMRE